MSTAPDPRLPLAEIDGERDLGEPPKVIDPGPGCRFAPRCPLVMDVCRTTTPQMVTISSTHRAACFAVNRSDPGVAAPAKIRGVPRWDGDVALTASPGC